MNKILKDIELLRKEMTRVAMHKGLTSIEAITISQELDQLLNLYEKMKQREKVTY
ncbi:aspartyl-phosphate phosphatase Spo0E family protein [Lentibacillus sp. L22]|uniref:aspartyl-phosphate phosphatase Spo0E family protein n=1 Tax=Lentibacillus TaxID=175304 RepID=UPI0022B13A83|nr:aspartyl-phosphate phosphatase Spo0E family protein [Lentibacillus daqui]